MKRAFGSAIVIGFLLGGLVTPAWAAQGQVRCVDKAGSASGLTRSFAEFEAFLIIRQVTGNWPVQTDRISAPSYRCRQDGALWQCTARARVCKM